jgi:hypothetical protein
MLEMFVVSRAMRCGDVYCCACSNRVVCVYSLHFAFLSSKGFGQWQTVSVREVDEEEELRVHRLREKEEREQQAAKKKVSSPVRALLCCAVL